MEIKGNRDAGDDVCTVKNAMPRLDVEHLDGEYVSGAREFVESKDERGTGLLFPPLHGGCDYGEVGGGESLQNTEQVDVGVFRRVFGRDGRAIENDGEKVLAGLGLHHLDEFVDALLL